MTEAKIGSEDRPVAPGAIHRRLIAVYRDVQAGRLDDALILIDPDVIDHPGGSQGDVVGRNAWREKWALMATTDFAKASMTIEENLEVGETSVTRYTVRGTDSASGRPYEVAAMDMIKVRHGRVVEHWSFLDAAAIRHQVSNPTPQR